MRQVVLIEELVIGDDCEIALEVAGVPEGVVVEQAWLSLKNRPKDDEYVTQSVIDSEPDEENGQILDSGEEGTAQLLFIIPREESVELKAGPAYAFDVQVLLSDGKLKTPVGGTIVFAPQVTTDVPA